LKQLGNYVDDHAKRIMGKCKEDAMGKVDAYIQRRRKLMPPCILPGEILKRLKDVDEKEINFKKRE
jgi:hypothetical protein